MAAMTNPQDNVTAFWSMVAPGYEAHGGNVPSLDNAQYQQWIDFFTGELPSTPLRVLDVATGTGFVALLLAALGHDVVAIDLSQDMLREATSTAAERGVRVEFREADAVSPPFEPATFDVVTCRHLLWTLREPEQAMANWRELLRAGGRVLAIDGFWFAGTTGPNEHEPEPFRRHYTSETRDALQFMHLDSIDPIIDAFERAGFRDVASRPLPELADADGDGDGAVPYVVTATR
jgi:ubiquinone/menaquinone biosynthesis C-methylase UbiE